jgi:hypothetical protein
MSVYYRRHPNCISICLRLEQFTQTACSAAYGGSSSGGDSPGTTSHGLAASTALPDANSLTLHSVLAAESASVTSVLCDFHLLDLLTQRSTVTRTVLAGDSYFASAFGLSNTHVSMHDIYNIDALLAYEYIMSTFDPPSLLVYPLINICIVGFVGCFRKLSILFEYVNYLYVKYSFSLTNNP